MRLTICSRRVSVSMRWLSCLRFAPASYFPGAKRQPTRNHYTKAKQPTIVGRIPTLVPAFCGGDCGFFLDGVSVKHLAGADRFRRSADFLIFILDNVSHAC